MQHIARLPDLQTPDERQEWFGFAKDNRVWTVAREQFWMQFFATHPYLSVYWHRPDDPYTSYQRLFVVFTLLFSFLAANAMFFGQVDGSQENAIAIAIYSSLIVAPIGVVFPILFKKAAYMIHSEREEESFLKGLNVNVIKKQESSLGSRLQMFSFAFMSSWVAGTIFLCLIYGMQVY